MIARNCNVGLALDQRGYSIESQGKAPEFVLEVASSNTGRQDYTDKRRDYELYGVGEYWRFDPSGGDWHDVPLAGEYLDEDGRFQPIEIEEMGVGVYRGYSEALGLYVCWEEGELRWYDPVSEEYLRTHDEDIARAELERAAREDAERRMVEMAEELRRLRGEVG